MISTKHRACTLVAVLFTASLLFSTAIAQENKAKPGDSTEVNPYMGAPVTLTEAPNGAIANKKILDGIDKVAWLKPTIHHPTQLKIMMASYKSKTMTMGDVVRYAVKYNIK